MTKRTTSKKEKVLLSISPELLDRLDASARRAKRSRSAEVSLHLEEKLPLPRRMRKAAAGARA